MRTGQHDSSAAPQLRRQHRSRQPSTGQATAGSLRLARDCHRPAQAPFHASGSNIHRFHGCPEWVRCIRQPSASRECMRASPPGQSVSHCLGLRVSQAVSQSRRGRVSQSSASVCVAGAGRTTERSGRDTCLASSGLVWSGLVWSGLAWPGLSCLASASPCACACARSLPSASDMLCGAAPTRLSGRRTDSRVGGRQSTVRL